LLRFVYSIFRKDGKDGKYPESLVKKAIERAVDGTDPWIRAVSGYKKKLRPAVLHAIDHVVAMVDASAKPLLLDHESYDTNPVLRNFFISKADLARFLERDKDLAEFKGKQGRGWQGATALLLMRKAERGILGAVLSGEVVMRDVQQTTVSFEGHRLLDLSTTEEDTLYQLKKRAFDHLLGIALGRITDIKTRRGKLEKHRVLLQSKLDLLQREGWGFDDGAEGKMSVAGVEKMLGEIDARLLEIGKDDKMLDVYLGVVTDVLGHAEEHLWVKKEKLIIDRMGIKRKEPANDAPEVTLDVMGDAAGRNLVASLVFIPA